MTRFRSNPGPDAAPGGRPERTVLRAGGRLLVLALAFPLAAGRAAGWSRGEAEAVRGITISCQTYGPEWGQPGFAAELEDLHGLGANWVAIHPYAGIRADGTVVDWNDGDSTPEWLLSPLRVARARGMKILVKPHLAYWGSPFSWRGDIEFPDPEQRARFFETYRAWIVALAESMGEADAFAVGTELDRLTVFEQPWRELIAEVRGVTDAKLTYAANWTDYERVPFWDALDAIGVQAYFPLAGEGQDAVDEAQLVAGWERVLPPLLRVHRRTGKPVVFTELGYNCSLGAASRPWEGSRATGDDLRRATELQERCFRVALRVLERERSWLRGAFLWKWFVGPAPRANFLLDTPVVRGVLASEWGDD